MDAAFSEFEKESFAVVTLILEFWQRNYLNESIGLQAPALSDGVKTNSIIGEKNAMAENVHDIGSDSDKLTSNINPDMSPSESNLEPVPQEAPVNPIPTEPVTENAEPIGEIPPIPPPTESDNANPEPAPALEDHGAPVAPSVASDSSANPKETTDTQQSPAIEQPQSILPPDNANSTATAEQQVEPTEQQVEPAVISIPITANQEITIEDKVVSLSFAPKAEEVKYNPAPVEEVKEIESDEEFEPAKIIEARPDTPEHPVEEVIPAYELNPMSKIRNPQLKYGIMANAKTKSNGAWNFHTLHRATTANPDVVKFQTFFYRPTSVKPIARATACVWFTLKKKETGVWDVEYRFEHQYQAHKVQFHAGAAYNGLNYDDEFKLKMNGQQLASPLKRLSYIIESKINAGEFAKAKELFNLSKELSPYQAPKVDSTGSSLVV